MIDRADLEARRDALQAEMDGYTKEANANICRMQGAILVLDELIAKEKEGPDGKKAGKHETTPEVGARARIVHGSRDDR